MNKHTIIKTILKVHISIIFTLGVLLQNTFAQDSSVTTPTLKYIGHSFIKIKTTDDKVIYIDPYNVNEFSDSADIVLITHEHDDHNQLYRVKLKTTCQVIRSKDAVKSGVYQRFTIGNVTVQAVAAYNQYHNKSAAVGYIVEFDSIKIYHAGDTGKITEMSSLADQNIDYALLPMDGTYTMTPEIATAAAAQIQAKNDIAIHTVPPQAGSYSDAIVARFTSPNKLVVLPGTIINLMHVTSLIEEKNEIVNNFLLMQNYPNPFNPSTTISYNLPKFSGVTLKVYNALGSEITTLVNSYQQAGRYSVSFNASGLSSGVYFYAIKAGNFRQIKRCVYIK